MIRAICLCLLSFLLAGAALNAAGPYSLIQPIAIGGDGGWDYIAVDSGNHRLYVSHGTKVVVIDTTTNAVVGEVPDTAGVHGIAVAPELGRGFISCGRENKVAIFDLKSLATLQKVATGENPDAILYEPTKKEVYAFNGHSQSATVIDAMSGNVTATVPLPGKPEFAVEDASAGRIYNNIEDKNVVVAIDIPTHAVVATWPIAPGEEASGLAIDAPHHRLFIGCSNKVMEMMDSSSGKVLGSVPIGQGVDANAFDPGTGYAFASSGDGTLTVAKVDANGALAVVQTLETPRRARTMTVDPGTHRIYTPTADFGPVPEGSPANTRPPILPNTFRVMVYGM
jgi:YVTN family beta-propeller protein